MSTPPLSSLILTDQRVLIAGRLLIKAEDGNARELTTTEIINETGLGTSTVCSNMKALAESGWFKVAWEDVDAYDFTRSAPRRRLSLREGIDHALAACLKDYKMHRPNAHRRQASRQVEYLAPRPEELGAPGGYTPVPCGAQMMPDRAALLLHCLKEPKRFHYPLDVDREFGATPGTARKRMTQCESFGLMTSVDAVRDGRPSRAWRLTEAGVKTAQTLSEQAPFNE